jgi:prolyl 4-hydroxylase
MKISLLVSIIPATYAAHQVLNAFGEPSYGVDVSFPVHHITFAQDQPLGDRQKLYDDFMAGCRRHYSGNSQACDVTEEDRVEMSVRQPASMQVRVNCLYRRRRHDPCPDCFLLPLQNYTSTGFKKVQAPANVFDLLSSYWNTHYDRREQEKWFSGSTYVNHWKAPTYMVNVEETSLRGGGQTLKRQIWEGVRPILEEWTGMELEPSSMYGIRQYTEGAILSPHADRNPLITSCIINVAQDVEEDWPLEVYGRDGLAYNVTMKPGDMVLYESHSLIHGRPFPLKGKYFANIFVSVNMYPWQAYETNNFFHFVSFFRFISSQQGKSFASKIHPL